MGANGKTPLGLLRDALGANANFRDGQQEAIDAILRPGARLLVVQKTGWGKSVVYFLATKLLREQGHGATLLVSPLLALMRNQMDLAERFSLNVASINSTNKDEWDALEEEITANTIDLLLISPERLGNPEFKERILPYLEKNLGLLVIDEAHCISDWGHDFRPDYQRILPSLNRLSPSVPVLATTATANTRVIEDLQKQLGHNLEVSRGSLMRESLRLSVFQIPEPSERLAWLAKFIPRLEGSGIVYTLTVNDARRVAEWLMQNGIDAEAYHADLENEIRIGLEERFFKNELRVLVATTALGMGYDKPDVAFIIHFQRPGSITSYYQQVGRAGRALMTAHVALLAGAEDDEIADYFINSAFPEARCFEEVIAALQTPRRTIDSIVAQTNQQRGKIEKAIKLLDVQGIASRTSEGWQLAGKKWDYDALRAEQISSQRQHEKQEMREYVTHDGCRMEFLARALDDSLARPCGKCDNCRGKRKAAPDFEPETVSLAVTFLCEKPAPILPKQWYPAGFLGENRRKIPEEERLSEGVALSVYNDGGWGKFVKQGKYELHCFDKLIEPSAGLIMSLQVKPEWLTWVPSDKQRNLVKDFARQLAAKLGIDAVQAVVKIGEKPPQKEMQNSSTQLANVWNAFQIKHALPGTCLLIDDITDSGWTLTAIGILLRRAGSGPVFPFALASARPKS